MEVTLNDIAVGMEIYDRQPRWFDYDYHPQVIQSINKDSIIVYEPGYFPKGKQFTINISDLSFDKLGNKQIIIH